MSSGLKTVSIYGAVIAVILLIQALPLLTVPHAIVAISLFAMFFQAPFYTQFVFNAMLAHLLIAGLIGAMDRRWLIVPIGVYGAWAIAAAVDFARMRALEQSIAGPIDSKALGAFDGAVIHVKGDGHLIDGVATSLAWILEDARVFVGFQELRRVRCTGADARSRGGLKRAFSTHVPGGHNAPEPYYLRHDGWCVAPLEIAVPAQGGVTVDLSQARGEQPYLHYTHTATLTRVAGDGSPKEIGSIARGLITHLSPVPMFMVGGGPKTMESRWEFGFWPWRFGRNFGIAPGFRSSDLDLAWAKAIADKLHLPTRDLTRAPAA